MNDSNESVADGAISSSHEVQSDHATESLDESEQGHTDPLWAAEALRRREDIRSGLVKTIPSDVALARVRSAVAR